MGQNIPRGAPSTRFIHAVCSSHFCAIRSRSLRAGSPLAAQRVVSSNSKQRHRQREKRSIRRLSCHTIEQLPYDLHPYGFLSLACIRWNTACTFSKQCERRPYNINDPTCAVSGIVYRSSTESPARIAPKPTIRNITAVPPEQKIIRPTPMASAPNRSNPNP